jgi:hypothetical protein
MRAMVRTGTAVIVLGLLVSTSAHAGGHLIRNDGTAVESRPAQVAMATLLMNRDLAGVHRLSAAAEVALQVLGYGFAGVVLVLSLFTGFAGLGGLHTR